MMIWGMVAAKAKTGLTTANKNDSSQGVVSQAFSKVVNLLILIALATTLNIYGLQQEAESSSQTSEKLAKHQLGATNSHHLPSFSDASSSHYLGGAHNVALETLKQKSDIPTKQQHVASPSKHLSSFFD